MRTATRLGPGAPGDRTATRWPALVPRGLTADALLALVVGAVEIVGAVLAADSEPASTPMDALAYTLLVVSAGSLVARRHYPSVVLVVAATFGMAYYPFGYPEGPVYLATLVALYSASAAGRRRLAIALVAGGFLFMLLFGVLLTPGQPVTAGELIVASGWAVAALIGGEVTRSRRAYLAEVEERAVQAEWMREEEGRRRAGEERLRIARELHDVLAHNISMMNVQAGVAAHLLDERPEQARSALLAIKDASKDALRELRATLGVLRQADDPDDTAGREPTPGLARLDELVARASATGLAIHVHTDGAPRELPDGTDLVAYRILQEALTNVTRHADAATATVGVAYGEGELRIQVDDDGKGAAAGHGPGGGHGLVGMRERAEAVGGGLEAGPRPEGGFRVHARLPLDRGRRDEGHKATSLDPEAAPRDRAAQQVTAHSSGDSSGSPAGRRDRQGGAG